MEHVIAGYLRQVLDTNKWLYEDQHNFRLGYSFERQIVTVCHITDSLVEGTRIDAIKTDFIKGFDLVLNERMLIKIAAPGVDLSVVVWVREFLLGRSQRVRVGGQLSEGYHKGAY
jgi:hypothetical protein